MRHTWPGNVRELRNAIERAVVFEDSDVLTINSLPPEILRQTMESHPVTVTTPGAEPKQAQAAASAIPVSAAVFDTHSSPLLPASRIDFSGAQAVTSMPEQASDEILTMDEEEKKIIMRALSITNGNISEAARKLGVHRSTLHRKMTRYGLATDEDLLDEAEA
jgi:DNA-binding NtrC family response regulator